MRHIERKEGHPVTETAGRSVRSGPGSPPVTGADARARSGPPRREGGAAIPPSDQDRLGRRGREELPGRGDLDAVGHRVGRRREGDTARRGLAAGAVEPDRPRGPRRPPHGGEGEVPEPHRDRRCGRRRAVGDAGEAGDPSGRRAGSGRPQPPGGFGVAPEDVQQDRSYDPVGTEMNPDAAVPVRTSSPSWVSHRPAAEEGRTPRRSTPLKSGRAEGRGRGSVRGGPPIDRGAGDARPGAERRGAEGEAAGAVRSRATRSPRAPPRGRS